jgi:hypothetical protein
MADEQNSIQVESSSDTLGEAPVKSTPGVTEQPTAGKPVDPSEGSEDVSDDEHGDEAGDEVGGEQQPGEPGKAKTPRGVQKKLDKLTARSKTAEQERDYWRAEALKAQQASKSDSEAPSKPSSDTKPTLEQFDYDQEAYLAAATAYNVAQELKKFRENDEKQKEQLTVAKKTKAWKEKADAFAEDHPDFQEVALNPSLPVTEVMAEVIRDSDVGHELLYFLGKNPEEAARIAQMKPHAVGVALGRIEAGLVKDPGVQFTDTVEREQPEKKVTQAPPPIKTLNPSAPVKRNLADMSMEDYVSERQRTRRKSNGFL